MTAEDRKKKLENMINNNLPDTVGLRLTFAIQVERAYPIMSLNNSC